MFLWLIIVCFDLCLNIYFEIYLKTLDNKYLDEYNNTQEKEVFSMTQNYLPKDAAEYPKTSATRVAMVETAMSYVTEYENTLKTLPKDAGLQKKALSIQRSIAQLCVTFAAMAFNQGTWAGQIATYTKRLNQQNILPMYEENLQSFTEDERGAFILYAHANWLLHNAFIDQHIAKFNAAIENGRPEAAFEDRIILGTIYTICREWRAWWLENGTAAFDMWTYEDSPWETEENA